MGADIGSHLRYFVYDLAYDRHTPCIRRGKGERMIIPRPKKLIAFAHYDGENFCAVGWLVKNYLPKELQLNPPIDFDRRQPEWWKAREHAANALEVYSSELSILASINNSVLDSEERIKILDWWLREHGHELEGSTEHEDTSPHQ